MEISLLTEAHLMISLFDNESQKLILYHSDNLHEFAEIFTNIERAAKSQIECDV